MYTLSIGSVPNINDLFDCIVCASGRFLDETVEDPNTSCTQCPIGKYIFDDEVATTAEQHSALEKCIPCNGGRWYDNHTQSCNVCPAGRIRTTADALTTVVYSCEACPIDTYNGFSENVTRDKHDENDDCVTCPVGQFTDEKTGAPFCSPCSAGKFTKGKQCINCPAGWNQEIAGQNECNGCASGFHQNEPGKPYCLPCVPGSHQNTTGQSDCKNCPIGWKQEDAGQNECNGCLPGFSQNDVGQASCLPCSPGEYNDVDAAVTCKYCGAHTFYGDKGRNRTCTNCPLGYVSEAGSAKCIRCGGGTFSNVLGGECLVCAQGQYRTTTVTNATACIHCPIGYSQTDVGQTSCLQCGPGEFNDVVGAGTCKSCLPFTYYGDKGRNKTCINCPLGWVSEVGSAKCIECGGGTFSNVVGGECLSCTQGQYRTSSMVPTTCNECTIGFYQNNKKQTSCLPCIPGNYQNVTGENSCKVCPANTKSTNANSSKCTSCSVGEKSDSGSAKW